MSRSSTTLEPRATPRRRSARSPGISATARGWRTPLGLAHSCMLTWVTLPGTTRETPSPSASTA
nr:MAG TPA: hypothetical protein [Caudoviricetes sp.]